MRYPLRFATALILITTGLLTTAVSAHATQPAYLTILLGRTQMFPTTGAHCQQPPDTVTLTQAADTLHSMGIPLTGAVIVDRTAETAPTCVGGDEYASWSQINALTVTDGMSFISAGVDYENNTLLTPQQAQANICGSLPAFTQHGQTRAWGLFAYPNNGHSTALQTDITDQCFAFGRKYGSALNDGVTQPFWAVTNSITGGACNTQGLVCSTLITVSASHTGNNTPNAYWSLPKLETALHPQAGQWSVVQMYKFVEGSYNTGATSGPRWDCTSPNWQNHYTSVSETYCWNDFLTALKTIPAGVTITDPATVAQSWGRTPSSN